MAGREGRALPASPRGGRRRGALVRILLLALAAGLVACSPGERGSLLVRGGGPTVQPVASTDSLSQSVGCAHIARLLHDYSTPMSELVLRRSDCPPEGAPGWIVVRDEQAFRNYEDIGRNIRAGVRPPAVNVARPVEQGPASVEIRRSECGAARGRRSRCRSVELDTSAGGFAPRRRASVRARSPGGCVSCSLDSEWSPP